MSDRPTQNPKEDRPLDLAEVTRLLSAIQQDLTRVKSGSKGLDALRAEVEALKASLGEPDAAVGEDDLHRVRSLLKTAGEEVEVDALKAAGYVAALGRILGLS